MAVHEGVRYRSQGRLTFTSVKGGFDDPRLGRIHTARGPEASQESIVPPPIRGSDPSM